MKNLLLSLSVLYAYSINGMDNPVSHLTEVETVLLERSTALVKAYEENPGVRKPIISIAGGSSVGKTHFSKKLLKLLTDNGIRARIFKLDRCFNPFSPLEYALEPSEFNNRIGEAMWQFDHRAAHQVLQAVVARQKSIIEPRANFDNNNITHTPIDHSTADIVIVEGLYTLTGPESYDFAQYGSLKLFMDAEKERILDWYCIRKRKKGHPNPKEDPITTWDFEEDYEKVIASSKQNADIAIQQNENREYYISINP